MPERALSDLRVVVGVPVKDPGDDLRALLEALSRQTLQPAHVILADSSADKAPVAAIALQFGATVIPVDTHDFDHGGTRNLLARAVPTDIVVFLTQDAIPASDNALESIVHALLSDAKNGAAFGRQLPRADMGPVAHHARAFTYPDTSYTWKPGYDPDSSRRLFCSNVFAAWRTDALHSIGWLPEGVISWEDTLGAARLLEHGWNVHYAAGSAVIHSHAYSLGEEFRRYFDMGAVHATQQWFTESYERSQREGTKFVRSELSYCRSAHMRAALPRVVVRNGARWLGYQAGKRFRLMPQILRRHWSQNKAYWERNARAIGVIVMTAMMLGAITSRVVSAQGAQGAQAAQVAMPSHPSSSIPADDWTLSAARRLHALGLTPRGYDRATATPEIAWYRSVFTAAASNAPEGELRELAMSYLQRFNEEHPSLDADGNGGRHVISGNAAIGFAAHDNPLLGGRAHAGVWSGAIAIDDTTDVTARLRVVAQPARWLSGSFDASAYTSGIQIREATLEAGAAALGLWAGRRAASYATTRSGAITWNGGVPFNAVGLHTLHPVRLPSILGVFGPSTFETMLARTDSEAPVPHPWFWTARFSAQPLPWAGATITRAAYAGTTDGSPITKRDLGNLIIGQNGFGTGSPNYIDNQIVSVDGWFRFFFLKPSPMFYWDWGAEDSHGAWWHVPGHTFGLTLPSVPGVEALSVGVERTLFDHSANSNPSWYRHGQFERGWSKDGYPLGNPLGGHGTETMIYADGDFTERGLKLGTTFTRGFRGEQNIYAPERIGTFHSITVTGAKRLNRVWTTNVSAFYTTGSSWSESAINMNISRHF